MRLTFLGTGSAMPTGDRVQTGLLLEAEDRRLLVDVGSGALHALASTEMGYEGVDALLLTHHHLDHVSDLMPLLKARWLAGEESFEIVGPPGTEALVEGLHEVHDYMQDRIDLSIREIEPETTTVAGFQVAAMETDHSMYCFAYRFDDQVTFSGDSEAMAELVDFAESGSILIHDCSFPDEVDVSNHPTPDSLGQVLAGAALDRVFLTHLYPHTRGKHEAMLDSIGSHYDGDVEFAYDGKRIEI